MKPGPAKTCPSCGERYEADVLFCPKDGRPISHSQTGLPSLTGAPGDDGDPYVGLELPGQIRIEHLIGIGSMGRVYQAFQGGIDRNVAVKVLHRELSGDPDLVARFHREAKVASRLVHPNVVQVLMTGTVPGKKGAGIGGELYLVMEHLDGLSLLSALTAAGASGEGQALPLPRALHIILQVCDAVGEAHAQGIVHRDLKPENVMLVRRGEDPDYVKVLDFGIARYAAEAASPQAAPASPSGGATGVPGLRVLDPGTQAGLIFGTARYISPEGAEGQPAGPQADVYSIATMLYQMLAGRTPFEADSPVALLVQHAHAPALELRSIARASYVPAPLSAAIMQNLAKKPSERAENARVLGRDLIAAARAGGLYPEEIAGQSTLMAPSSFGAVKLASKERTRSHELSAGLAAKIGGVAAKPAEEPVDHVPGPGDTMVEDDEISLDPPMVAPAPVIATPIARRSSTRGPVAPTQIGDDADLDFAGAPPDLPTSARSRPVMPPFPVDAVIAAAPVEAPAEAAGIDGVEAAPAVVATAPPSQPQAPAVPAPSPSQAAASPAPPPAEPVLVNDGPGRTAPAAPLAAGSTIQGTERSVDPPVNAARARKARNLRLALLGAAALAMAPLLVFGGRRLAAPGPDSLEATVEEARDSMQRHAWDAPSGHNFKETLGRALGRWPDNPAVLDLRREAGERLVAEAIRKKYAGDNAEATHLVRLALEINPSDSTAQQIAAELESMHPPDVAPSASSSVGPGAGSPKKPRGPIAGPRPSEGPREPRSGPAPTVIVQPAAPGKPEPGGAPPVSSGPWL